MAGSVGESDKSINDSQNNSNTLQNNQQESGESVARKTTDEISRHETPVNIRKVTTQNKQSSLEETDERINNEQFIDFLKTNLVEKSNKFLEYSENKVIKSLELLSLPFLACYVGAKSLLGLFFLFFNCNVGSAPSGIVFVICVVFALVIAIVAVTLALGIIAFIFSLPLLIANKVILNKKKEAEIDYRVNELLNNILQKITASTNIDYNEIKARMETIIDTTLLENDVKLLLNEIYYYTNIIDSMAKNSASIQECDRQIITRQTDQQKKKEKKLQDIILFEKKRDKSTSIGSTQSNNAIIPSENNSKIDELKIKKKDKQQEYNQKEVEKEKTLAKITKVTQNMFSKIFASLEDSIQDPTTKQEVINAKNKYFNDELNSNESYNQLFSSLISFIKLETDDGIGFESRDGIQLLGQTYFNRYIKKLVISQDKTGTYDKNTQQIFSGDMNNAIIQGIKNSFSPKNG